MKIFNNIIERLKGKKKFSFKSLLNKLKHIFKLRSWQIKVSLTVLVIVIGSSLFLAYGQSGSTSSKPSLTKGLIAHYTMDMDDYEEGTVNLVSNPDGKALANGTPGDYKPGWDASLHNDAILASGWGSGYNSGVGSPAIGYHAKWVYEGIDGPNDPCMKFIDLNNEYNLGHRWLGMSVAVGSPNSLGLSVGDVVTVSWWQKSNVIGKGAEVGLYHGLLTGSYGFESNISTVYVTKINNWERASYTTTITSNWDLSKSFYYYVYGMYGNYGTLWVDNVQLEKKAYATPFVNGTRQDRVVDKTSYSNHGVNYGATTAIDRNGKEGGAMSFDGIDDRVSINYTNPVEKTSAFAWFKRNGAPAGGYHIITGGGVLELSIPDYSGEIRTGIYTNTQGRQVFNSGSGLSDGNWHLVGMTYDGTTLESYIDGVVTASNSVSGNLSGAATEIGRYLSNSYAANGLIDDVRFYNRALSEEEALLLYNSYEPKAQINSINKGLIGHWTLDQEDFNSSTNRVTDKSAYSNHGTYNGASFARDRYGKDAGAMSFNGVNDYIEIQDSESLSLGTNDFTINMWVNFNQILSGGSFNGGILLSKSAFYTTDGFHIGIDWEGLQFRTADANGTNVVNYSARNFQMNRWYNLTFIRSKNNTQTIYIDSNKIVETEFSTKRDVSSLVNFYIGRGYSNKFNGSISDVRIYNRALSDDEVSLLHSSYSHQSVVTPPPASCKEILDSGKSTGDGVYKIRPGLNPAFDAYCDMTTDGGGWTLVLLNNKGLISPTPVWNDAIYSVNTTGDFGSNLSSFDLFLGLNHWQKLGSKMRLQIGPSSTSLTNKAIYSGFSFTGTKYTLGMSGQTILLGSGSPGMFSYHNTGDLSTIDIDNDIHSSHCSVAYGGTPWWYKACWDGNFWGYNASEGARWTGSSAGTEQQHGSIWIGQ